MFEVSVKTLDGDSKTFQIDDEDLTVSAFKEMIAADMNIPIDRQRLIFQGKVLVDEKKLKDCGVESKTIHLVPRPPPQRNNEGGPSTSHIDSQQVQSPSIASNFPGIRGAVNSILSSLPNLNFPLSGPSSNLSTGQAANSLFNSLQRQATNLLNTIDSEGISTTNASSDNRTTSEADASASRPRDSAPTPEPPPPPVDFGRLADMVAEQRTLWQRLGQHLDRWEAMLRSEHEAGRVNQTPEGCTAASSSHSPVDGLEPMDVSDVTTHVAWSDSFFENVSAALHLHAHMLHLFSEFCVPPRASVVTNPSSVTDAESEASANPPPRTLVINEPIANILHAHINIEPTVVTIARPVVSVSRETSEASTRRRSQSANPPAVNATNTDTTPVSLGTDGATSASASARSRAATPSSGTGGAFNIPTTVVFDTPMLGGQAPSGLTAQLFESVYSHLNEPMRQATSAQQPQSNSGTPTPHVGISAPPGSRGRTVPRIRSTASSGNTNDPRRQHPPTFLPTRFGLAGEDIFLPCNSRHSLGRSGSISSPSVTVSGGRARRRRSLVGAAAAAVSAVTASRGHGGIGGSSARRGRSAGSLVGGTPANTTSNIQNTTSATEALSTVRNILNTVTTAATAMSAAESFGGTNDGHLGQILAEFDVTPDGISTVASTTSGGSSSGASGTVTAGPFGWIFAPSRIGGFEFFIPSHGSGPTPPTAVTNTRLTMMPEILIDGLIRSIWCTIYRISHVQIPESLPSVAIDAWGSGSSQYPFNRYADDSCIRPLISSLVGGLCEVTSQLTEDNFDTLIRHAVDRSRPLIQRLLNNNLQEDDTVVLPDLTNFLLNSFPTDESNFSLPDSVFFSWATSRAAEVGNDPLDIRRSLHNFLTGSLLRQMPLWRDADANGALGTVILKSLSVIMVELLGFCHLLVQRAVELLGLQLNASTAAVEITGSVGEAERIATFGHSMSFEPMMALLRNFNNDLQEGSSDRSAMNLILRGVEAIVTDFLANGTSRFNENRERLLSYLATRPLPPSRLATTRTNPPASSFKVDKSEDSDDTSEIYMDASEESPSPIVPSTSNSAQLLNGDVAIDTTGIFPDWGTQEVHLSPAEALAPNPLSSWRPPQSSINHPPSPAAFPSEWADIVASDAVQMSAAVSVDAVGQEDPASGGDDTLPSVRRLSDAYIAGMPVKRRRIMLERKQNLTYSANTMFMNILKEAMSASPLPVASPAGPTEVATTRDVVVAEANTPLSQLSPPPHVSEAFRAYVTEHLSRRLASDPDFDARRHPTAGAAFGRRGSPSSSTN